MTTQPNERLRILVADDEEVIRTLYRDVLTPNTTQAPLSAGPYELTLCSNGAGAIAAVRQAVAESAPYALVFLDIRMPPGPNGLDTATAIHTLDPNMQIIFVTAHADVDPSEIEKVLPQHDRWLHIQKPFPAHEIRQLAAAFTARWRTERSLRRSQHDLEEIVATRTFELLDLNTELRRSHDRLARAQEAALIGDWEFDVARKLIHLSADANRILGWGDRSAEIPLDKLRGMIASGDQRRVTHAFLKLLRHGEPFNQEFSVRVDGATSDKIIHARGQTTNSENDAAPAIEGFVQDITERKRTEVVLESILVGTSQATSGTDFFKQLVLCLAKSLGVRYAIIGRVIDPNRLTSVRTTAVCASGQILDNFVYDLAGTPCGNVVGQVPRLYPRNVQELFPGNKLLMQMGVEGFLGIPLFSSAGKPLGILTAMHDQPFPNTEMSKSILTAFAGRTAAELERLQAEEEIVAANERLTATLAALPDLLFETDDKGRILNCSPPFGRYPAGGINEDPTGRTIPEVFPAQAAHTIAMAIAEAGLRNARTQTIYQIDTPSGLNWFELSITVRSDAPGTRKLFTALAHDITPLKDTERILNENEAKYHTLFESAGDAIFIASLSESEGPRIEDANECALRLFGYTREQMLGASAVHLSPPLQPDGHSSSEHMQRNVIAVLDGRPQFFEWVHQRWDKSCFESEVTLTRINLSGKPFIQAIVRDITTRKRAEAELRGEHSVLNSLTRVQSRYIAEADPSLIFDTMLTEILSLTESKIGFIGEVFYDDEGTPTLKVHAISNIDWNEETPAFYELHARNGLVFQNPTGLLGAGLTSAEPIIVNDPGHDPRACGLPKGHPPLDNFLSLPLLQSGTIIGMAGVANREGGYTSQTVEYLKPLLTAAANLIDACRGTQKRRQVEIALREKEDLLRATIESTADGILVVDGNGRVIHINSRFGTMWRIPDALIRGGDDDELLKFAIEQLVDPDLFLDKVRELYQTTREDLDILHFKDGRVFERYSRPLEREGQYTGRVWSFRDITERMQHQAENTRLAAFPRNNPNCIIVCDATGAISYSNPAAQTLMDTLEIPSARGLLPVDHEKQIAACFQQPDSPITTEVSYGNRVFQWSYHHVPVMDVAHLYGTDVTAEKRQQTELARARRLESAGQLAGQIAHDFNNLLGPLVVYPEMARASLSEDSPVHRMLDIIENCATQMSDINQQLLTLGRRGHYNVEPLNLSRIVEETLKNLDFPNTVVIKTRLDANLALCRGGHAQIQRVLCNLLSNAAEAMEEVGTIMITTENLHLEQTQTRLSMIDRGDYACVRICDNGPGIPESIAERIFDPFFSTKKADKHRGSGLGLSIVHSVMEDHDGYVDMETAPGQGTTISLYFPMFQGELAHGDESTEVAGGNGEHILIVDDDAVQRQVTEDALTQLGYTVSTVSSGELAVTRADREEFDLLILDMVMDGIDGVETLRQVRAIRPGQIALMLSGFATNHHVEEAFQIGAREFLAKPVRMKALAAAVARALHSREAATDAAPA